MTHQFLLKEIWGSPHLHDTHYLRIFMRKLRQKIDLEVEPPLLRTVRSAGYMLSAVN